MRAPLSPDEESSKSVERELVLGIVLTEAAILAGEDASSRDTGAAGRNTSSGDTPSKRAALFAQE